MSLRKNSADQISTELVRDNWDQICDFTNGPMYPESAQEIVMYFAKALHELTETSANKKASLSPVVCNYFNLKTNF